MTDERSETLFAALAAVAAGQQVLLERLLRQTDGVAVVELEGVAHDVRRLLVAVSALLRHGPPSALHGDK